MEDDFLSLLILFVKMCEIIQKVQARNLDLGDAVLILEIYQVFSDTYKKFKDK